MHDCIRDRLDSTRVGQEAEIAEIGGTPVADEMLVNVLWMAMDPGTRSHVSSKIDANADVDFQVMTEAVMRHTTLVVPPAVPQPADRRLWT